MTLPFLARRVTTRPRRRIAAVSDSWRRLPSGEFGRQVVVIEPDGRQTVRCLPDAHPALVAFLARAAA